MKKRTVSILLTVALLLGAVGATGVLTAGALTAGWTAGDGGLGQYQNFDRYSTLSSVMGEDAVNLIHGQIPYGYPKSPYGQWQSSNASQAVGNMTDGVIGINKVSDWAQIAATSSSSRYLYFDLGANYSITDFVVASAQYKGMEYGLLNVRIWVAKEDDNMAATSAPTAPSDKGYKKVYEKWEYAPGSGAWNNAGGGYVNFHIQPTDAIPEEGRYVCFELKSTAADTDDIYIGELAVYGTEIVEDTVNWQDGDSGKGRYTTLERYADISGFGKSLIEGKKAYGSVFSKAEWANYDKADSNGDIACLTDGSVGNQESPGYTVLRDGSATYNRYVYFDLGKLVNITDFVVASAQAQSGDALLKYMNIYVAKTDDAFGTFVSSRSGAGEGYEPVFKMWGHTDSDYNFHIQPTGGEAVVGRYVCFEFKSAIKSNAGAIGAGHLYIGELAVYGEPAAALGAQVAGTYTVEEDGKDVEMTKLRFVFDVDCSGVQYKTVEDNPFYADYTAGKIVIDGTTYDVAGMGALVARSVKLAEEDELVMEILDPSKEYAAKGYVVDIPGEKLYDITTTGVQYTAVITNVPADKYDEVLVARPYVAYYTDESKTDVAYLYGPKILRSVKQVQDKTDLA